MDKKWKDFYTAVDSFAWSKQIKPFVDALRDQRREQIKELIARGYSSISLERCQDMLGLPKDLTIQVLTEAKWRVDQEKDMVFPTSGTIGTSKLEEQHTSSKQLTTLTQYVIHLEQP